MCWPQLVGGVEILERRPRTWNEPRHKRLNFVRSHQRDSDEWVLARPYPSRLTQREIWDRRRAREMEEQRLMQHQQHQGFHDPRVIQMQPAPPPWHHNQPGHHGPQRQLDRHSHHSDDSIIDVDDFGHDGHDGHDGHHQPRPHIIHLEPPKSRLPKGLKTHAKKSRGHKKKYSISSSSSDDSSSSDGSSAFVEGLRAGRRSVSRRPVPRGRSRSRFTDDSFEDLMHPRVRSRSRRGRW